MSEVILLILLLAGCRQPYDYWDVYIDGEHYVTTSSKAFCELEAARLSAIFVQGNRHLPEIKCLHNGKES